MKFAGLIAFIVGAIMIFGSFERKEYGWLIGAIPLAIGGIYLMIKKEETELK